MLLSVLTGVRPSAAQINLDGGVFVVKDDIYQSSDIFLGFSSTAALYIEAGAPIASLNAYKTSVVNLMDGQIGSVADFHNRSALYMTGGAIPTLILDDNSAARIGGGEIDSLYANDKSQVRVKGGNIGRIGGFGSDLIYISGGTVGEIDVQSLNTTVLMSAGTVTDFTSVGSVLISGGNLTGTVLRAFDQATYTFYGFKYNLSSGMRGFDKLTGSNGTFFTLTGYLPNGSPVNATLFDADGGNLIGGPNSLLTFVTQITAPEPTPLALLSCGAIALRLLRRPRRRQLKQRFRAACP